MNNSLERPIKLGRISYTNAWPVFHHFDPTILPFQTEIHADMPATLNRKLRAGDIDMAAISSYAYGISSESYYLLPNLSVSSLGRVQSILLFLKSPLEKVIHGKIALTITSATSVNLLKIIMEKFYGGKPTYEDAEPSLEKMLENADAALLIGDHAIRASWENKGYRVLDLGEVWNVWTGRWMTYALWAVHKNTAQRYPEAINLIYEGLLESKRKSSRDLEPIVSKAMSQIGGTSQYWHNYYQNLCHDFGPEHKAGLQLYFQYARELGLMSEEVELLELPSPRVADNLPNRR
ncbi:menaquinone biosynthetic enzyme MqnA/MqnD family protein [Cohnella luojiensis]|uniref:Chorismate dehydratase n=1 Tax=Cohnella luojiensis TaxID=652876 RepID=A0A4Y8M3F7_9BACL|nr:menaquinone biosynthesis protein [Cohnella luojiensis]TFE29997.1 ABC transporter substrate-binding protein [Cohnella luojiensis]